MTRCALIILLLVPLLGHTAMLGTERSWEFMQSVGGVALGEPECKGEAWLLPLLCDVSGLQAITVKPTMLNSGLVWTDAEAITVGREIHITIATGPVTRAGKSSACGAANLGNIKPGKYRVLYRDPNNQMHLIGEVELGP